MHKLWVIVDGNNTAHRASHTVGHLSYGEDRTGVVYGFLSQVRSFMDMFDPRGVVLAFDHGRSIRFKEYSKYKHKRIEAYAKMDEQQLFERQELRRQIEQLKKKTLKKMGFRNVLYAKGFEADDVIGSVCQNLPKKQTAIIVSTDHDFYQLLSERVTIYDPKMSEFYTSKHLAEEFGIEPSLWTDVKAIAGCYSDDIEGVEGVGEKSAAKYLAGKLKRTSQYFTRITEGNRIWRRNLPLVVLPHADTPKFKLRKDKVTTEKWNHATSEFGIAGVKKRKKNGEKEKKKKVDKGFLV